MNASSGPVLELRGASKFMGNSWVLRDINLVINPGEFTLVIGENGAGKTTLLRTISGLTRLVKGEVVFSDTGLSPHQSRGRINFCGVDSFLYQELSLKENLLLFSKLSGMH